MNTTSRYIRVSPTVFAELKRGPLTVRALWEEGMVDDDRMLNPGEAWRAVDRLASGASLLERAYGADSMETRYFSPEDAAQIDHSLRNANALTFQGIIQGNGQPAGEGDEGWEVNLAALKSFFHEAAASEQYVLFVRVG